jgi:DNA-directed RNA polymerase specialized sigma24 family protein
MQEKLRNEVKLLKALQGVSYTEVAELLEISRSAMYNWLHNQYDLSI